MAAGILAASAMGTAPTQASPDSTIQHSSQRDAVEKPTQEPRRRIKQRYTPNYRSIKGSGMSPREYGERLQATGKQIWNKRK